MSNSVIVHLVRHGEVYNPQKILYGRLAGFGLSETGRQQAQATAQALATKPIHAIYASPQQRAQETAQFIATPHGLPIQTDARLDECLTPHEGRPLAELEATFFDIYTGNQPPYEQPADLRERLLDFVRDMAEKHPQQELIAVTHGDTLVAGFLMACEQPANDIARNRLQALGLPTRYPATASVLTLSYQSSFHSEQWLWNYFLSY